MCAGRGLEVSMFVFGIVLGSSLLLIYQSQTGTWGLGTFGGPCQDEEGYVAHWTTDALDANGEPLGEHHFDCAEIGHNTATRKTTLKRINVDGKKFETYIEGDCSNAEIAAKCRRTCGLCPDQARPGPPTPPTSRPALAAPAPPAPQPPSARPHRRARVGVQVDTGMPQYHGQHRSLSQAEADLYHNAFKGEQEALLQVPCRSPLPLRPLPTHPCPARCLV